MSDTTIKTQRPKFLMKKHLPARAKDTYAGEEYVNGIYNKKGERVIRPLNAEEKGWLNNFNEGYCQNNHRDNPVFTSHPEYESRIKSEMDAMCNKRNRDVQFIKKDKRNDAVMDNLCDNFFDRTEREKNLVQYGIKIATNMLIEETDELLSAEALSDSQRSDILREFALQFHKNVQDEKANKRKQAKKRKEEIND